MPGRMVASIHSSIAQLRGQAPRIGPSLLSCDFARLEREVQQVEEAGAQVLHLDVMDGHFVPNLSFGIPVVEAIRRVTRLPLDVHLMISDPARYAQAFRNAGADWLTFHIEAVPRPEELLERIRGWGAAAGLSLNPPTPLSAVEPYLTLCDLVLVMSVMPGFGGQTFDPVGLEKLASLRASGPAGLLLSIDGGVNDATIESCTAAGADLCVVGSAFFSHSDYRRRMAELLARARAGASPSRRSQGG